MECVFRNACRFLALQVVKTKMAKNLANADDLERVQDCLSAFFDQGLSEGQVRIKKSAGKSSSTTELEDERSKALKRGRTAALTEDVEPPEDPESTREATKAKKESQQYHKKLTEQLAKKKCIDILAKVKNDAATAFENQVKELRVKMTSNAKMLFNMAGITASKLNIEEVKNAVNQAQTLVDEWRKVKVQARAFANPLQNARRPSQPRWSMG